MHYIFYETGNDVFFSHIADTFCSVAVRYIADRYHEFVQPESGIIDQNAIKIFLEKNRNIINPLSCALFCDCGDQQCRNNHRAVLASDQRERFLSSMEQTLLTFYRTGQYHNQVRDRINYQTIFQSYFTVSGLDAEEINIVSRINPIEYKHSNPEKYKRLYAAQAGKLMKEKANMYTDAFVYIRSQTNSHFDYFARKTGLPNLRPCDLR